MDEKYQRARALCLEQAATFISAAERLSDEPQWRHVVYHLSLLALEEVGKASILSARAVKHDSVDNSWLDNSLEDHRRKLQWAVWSPMLRINPKDFEQAREFAERAHAMRKASLYVDTQAELTDPPPSEVVQKADADGALSLAKKRLELERGRGVSTGEMDGLTVWFLDIMSDPERYRFLLRPDYLTKFAELGGDARAWVQWARDEINQEDRQLRELLNAELGRGPAEKGAAKPRWRANLTIYTPSHSLRAKVLAKWNEALDHVQLLWSDKKDRFTLQITLHDNLPLDSLQGRLSSLAKIVLACLNIATIGYFWFEPAGFQKEMFKGVLDIEHGKAIDISVRESFWGNSRAVALTEEMIDRAVTCMMAFMPLTEAEAEPIFSHYFHGLAFISKSDIYYNLDDLARRAFIASLFEAMRSYGDWSGKREDMDSSLHVAFSEIIPEQENRDLLFKSLRTSGNPDETSLNNLRTAKQVTDLYLNLVAKKTWRRVLDADSGS